MDSFHINSFDCSSGWIKSNNIFHSITNKLNIISKKNITKYATHHSQYIHAIPYYPISTSGRWIRSEFFKNEFLD